MIKKEEQEKIRKEFGKFVKQWRLERNIGFRDFFPILDMSALELTKIEEGLTEKEKQDRYKKFIKKLRSNKDYQAIVNKCK